MLQSLERQVDVLGRHCDLAPPSLVADKNWDQWALDAAEMILNFVPGGDLGKLAIRALQDPDHLASLSQEEKLDLAISASFDFLPLGKVLKLSGGVGKKALSAARKKIAKILNRRLEQQANQGTGWMQRTINQAADWLGLGARRGGGQTAYEVAKQGGKHAGMYRKYRDHPENQLYKSIRSLKKKIEIHKNLMRDPARYLREYGKETKGPWHTLDPGERRALLTEGWPAEIQRFEEQIDIIKGILTERK